MARRQVTGSVNPALQFIALFLFLTGVSSQICKSYPHTCTCTMELFNCTSANLTEFPSNLSNAGALLRIDLSHNTITEIDSDVLSAYTQLQTVTLVGNGLSRIAEQTLPATFKKIDLSMNPIVCDGSLSWLTSVTTVLGMCSSGQEISAFLEGLKPTSAVPASGPTQQNLSTDVQTQPMTDAPSQHMSTATVGITTQQPEPNRLYVIAIVIPILVIVVIIIAVVVFSIRKNRKQQEAYNSSIRYSVVRKVAGAPSNRVYSDVTTEL